MREPMRSIPFAIIEYLSARKAGGDEDAARLLGRLPKTGARKRLAPGKSREERRAEQKEKSAGIREIVMTRAAGRCEWCGAEGMRLELHHALSGSGTRRAMESVQTCAAICADCHRLVHRNARAALTLARTWAERGPYSGALAAIQRRIDKADEARRTA